MLANGPSYHECTCALKSTSLGENLCHPSPKEFMVICLSSGPLCRAVVCLAESYESFKMTEQVFLLNSEQLKPIANKHSIFSEREAASVCKYCSVLLQHHECICFLPSREAVDVISGDAIIFSIYNFIDNEISGETRIM